MSDVPEDMTHDEMLNRMAGRRLVCADMPTDAYAAMVRAEQERDAVIEQVEDILYTRNIRINVMEQELSKARQRVRLWKSAAKLRRLSERFEKWCASDLAQEADKQYEACQKVEQERDQAREWARLWKATAKKHRDAEWDFRRVVSNVFRRNILNSQMAEELRKERDQYRQENATLKRQVDALIDVVVTIDCSGTIERCTKEVTNDNCRACWSEWVAKQTKEGGGK
jgi:exonuclease VII large subunit